MSIKSISEQALEKGNGVLRLAPTWVPRSFCRPGKRIKLHPDDYYVLGLERGGIDERWFASTTHADNGPGTPEDEGLSYVVVNDDGDERILLKDVIEELKSDIIGNKLWDNNGGFENRKATSAAAYMNFFRLCKNGLGDNSFIDERLIGHPGTEFDYPGLEGLFGGGWVPFSDITIGNVDSQRVWGDSNEFTPEMVLKCTTRWYKTRVLYAYDTDSKTFFSHKTGRKPERFSDEIIKTILTMVYVVSGRLLLADSFREMDEKIIHYISRTFPYHTTPKTARPIDLFSGGAYPQIYDFEINQDWHQITLYNGDFENSKTVKFRLSDKGIDKNCGIGLDPKYNYYLYDFWNENLIGVYNGDSVLEQELRGGESRMISLHRVENNPQFLSTNRHIMQGYIDMTSYPQWDQIKLELKGLSNVIENDLYKIVIAMNGYNYKSVICKNADATVYQSESDKNLLYVDLHSTETGAVEWEITFTK